MIQQFQSYVFPTVPVISLLNPSSIFIFHCLLCDNGAKFCKYFSFVIWYNVKLCSRGFQKQNGEEKDFPQIRPLQCAHSFPAVPSDQKYMSPSHRCLHLTLTPSGSFVVECHCQGTTLWMASPGVHRAASPSVPFKSTFPETAFPDIRREVSLPRQLSGH